MLSILILLVTTHTHLTFYQNVMIEQVICEYVT